jgi:transposase-like protein
MTQKPEILDKLLKDCKTPGDVESLYSQLLQRMINRSLEAERDVHPGDGKQVKSASDEARNNTRNGKSHKTVKGDFGELEIETPRDREGSFEPRWVKKRKASRSLSFSMRREMPICLSCGR